MNLSCLNTTNFIEAEVRQGSGDMEHRRELF